MFDAFDSLFTWLFGRPYANLSMLVLLTVAFAIWGWRFHAKHPSSLTPHDSKKGPMVVLLVLAGGFALWTAGLWGYDYYDHQRCLKSEWHSPLAQDESQPTSSMCDQ